VSRGRADDTDDRIRHEVKRELRKRMRAVRGALPASACDARSNEIAKRVVALKGFAAAKTLLAFASMRKEVRTRGIMEAAWELEKQVVLPRMVEETLVLHRIEPATPLVEGAFGVPEPPEACPTVAPRDIDFALVPALAVDPRGHRIGYGGGFYDRLLPLLRHARSCALVFDFQLVAEVPELPTDVMVDIVVTDTRVIVTD
jgi:5-formyltetrahydrofolate cyclo-ligase